jgi:hypothetical protein
VVTRVPGSDSITCASWNAFLAGTSSIESARATQASGCESAVFSADIDCAININVSLRQDNNRGIQSISCKHESLVYRDRNGGRAYNTILGERESDCIGVRRGDHQRTVATVASSGELSQSWMGQNRE